MHIDWFTFVAQVLNFLLLVWLLKRFLYGPVTRAMERREAFIEARLREAGEREEAADERAATYDDKLRALDVAHEEKLREVAREAESERRRLLDAARDELAETRGQWQRQLEEEKSERLAEIKRRIVGEVCAVSRRALCELADAELEGQMVRVFLRRITEMERDERDRLCHACAEPGSLTLHTPFELSGELKSEARASLAGIIPEGRTLEFAVTERFECGVELEIPGRTISWTLEDYLQGLEARLAFNHTESK